MLWHWGNILCYGTGVTFYKEKQFYSYHLKHSLTFFEQCTYLDVVSAPESELRPIFGVALSVAVDRRKCHDAIQLPVIFRECVDYIEEIGMLNVQINVPKKLVC